MLRAWNVKIVQEDVAYSAVFSNKTSSMKTHDWVIDGLERQINNPPLRVYREFLAPIYMKPDMPHPVWLFPLDIEFLVTAPLRAKLISRKMS